jgi:2-acylglycerol O-acyltransferase 2
MIELSKEELLLRISQLEEENRRLKLESESKKVTYYKDVYENIRKLQENFKDQFAQSYENLRRHARPYNLQPYIEAAAKSRNIDVSVVINSISPKNRQLFACILTFMLLPVSMLTTLVWMYMAIFNDKYHIFLPLLLIYATHIYFDDSHIKGNKGKSWLKRLFLWKLLGNYFPVLLVKHNPDTVYDPNEIFMFGYHPHGIISVGCFVSFAADATGASEMFPGIRIHPATLNSNFFIPFWRELLLRLGVISVSASAIKSVLGKGPGNAALIVPGGAAEALDAHPGRHSLTLNRRQGFFRIALQHGASLVPIYSFGENDLFEQARNVEGSLLRKIQNALLKYMGFATPFFSGAGCNGGSLPMNPIPFRVPIVTVVGDPIKCPLIENPTQSDIDSVRVLYVEKLQEIFKKFADQYAPDRREDLEIVK